MYNYIESEYKKYSSNRKFSIIYFSIAGLLYTLLVILGLFDFDDILISTFILLNILIFIMYIIIFIKLEFKPKDWKLFFRFKENKQKFKQKIHENDVSIIKNILIKLKIKRRNDIKLIIEHYRLLAINAKKKYNYINIISTIIAIFVSFKDILINKDNQLTDCFTFLIIILILFSILYFCFIQIIDLKSIINGNKNLYKNLEDLLTEEYIHQKQTLY